MIKNKIVLVIAIFLIFGCEKMETITKEKLDDKVTINNSIYIEDVNSFFRDTKFDFNDLSEKLGREKTDQIKEIQLNDCRNLKSLDGIKNFKGLKSLVLSGLNALDIRDLKNVLTLQSFEIYHSSLKTFDLNFLPENLTRLVISSVEIEKIDMSNSNNSLNEILIYDTKNWEKFFSSNYFRLEQVMLSGLSIKNVEFVLDFIPKSVKRLILSKNEIEYISLIKDWKNISYLNLFRNPISKKYTKILSKENEFIIKSKDRFITINFENPTE